MPKSKPRRGFGQVFKKRRDSSTWYIRFADPAKPKTAGGRASYTVRAVGPSKKEAERLLCDVHRAILSGTYAAQPSSTTVRLITAVDEYIESKVAEGRAERGVRRYRTSRRAIAESPLANVCVSVLSPRDLENYMAWRRERRWGTRLAPGSRRGDKPIVAVKADHQVSNSTVNRDLALIGAAIQRLVRLGHNAQNPVRLVRRAPEAKRSRVALSKDETARVIMASDRHFRSLAIAAAYTGARPKTELQALTWGDVSIEDRTLAIVRTKVGNASTIRMHPVLARELQILRERRGDVADSEHVFLSSRGRANWDYRYAWKKALRRAGLGDRPGLTFYAFRHGFATHFLGSGGASSDLQEILGHASIATTDHYVRMVNERASASIEAVDYGLGEEIVRTPLRTPSVSERSQRVHGA